MKIIENPEPVKCENCGCVFSFDKEDIKTDWYWDPQAFLGILGLSKDVKEFVAQYAIICML